MLKALLGNWIGSWPNLQAFSYCFSDCDFICITLYTYVKQIDFVRLRWMVLLYLLSSRGNPNNVINTLASLGTQEMCLQLPLGLHFHFSYKENIYSWACQTKNLYHVHEHLIFTIIAFLAWVTERYNVIHFCCWFKCFLMLTLLVLHFLNNHFSCISDTSVSDRLEMSTLLTLAAQKLTGIYPLAYFSLS